MTPRLLSLWIATILISLPMLPINSAQAAETWTGAAGLCQSATPSYEGSVRKRPLAFQNEGTATAFVTCNLVAVATPTAVTIRVSSLTSGPKTLSCTAVVGTVESIVYYSTQSVSFAGVSPAPSVMTWLPIHFGGAPNQFPSKLVSFSCVLPPGTAMHHFILTTP